MKTKRSRCTAREPSDATGRAEADQMIYTRSSSHVNVIAAARKASTGRPAAAAADEYYLGAVHARRHVSTAHKPDVRQKPQKKKKSLSVQHAYYRGIGRVYVLFSRVNTTTGFSVFIFIIVTRKKVDSFRLELKRIKRQTTATSGKS